MSNPISFTLPSRLVFFFSFSYGFGINDKKGTDSYVCVFLQEGFKYHHAEPDYLMLVYWIPEIDNSLPENASHRVGIGAFVMNSNREVWLCLRLWACFPISMLIFGVSLRHGIGIKWGYFPRYRYQNCLALIRWFLSFFLSISACLTILHL